MITFMLVWLAGSTSAVAAANVVANTARRGPDTPAELEAFLDAYTRGRTGTEIPGLVFVFVKDGELFFSKGYGYADLTSRRPVIPEETVFRVASISKVFTATAVMRLIERGEMALDAPINDYLDIHIADAFDRQITVADLLSHTSGLDQKIVDIGTRTADRVSLHRWAKTRQPHRSLPPGDLFSYSNFGISLLGLAIERVSGRPFTDYMTEEILIPLGMQRSSFSMTPDLAEALATGYIVRGADTEEAPRWQCNMLPSSTLVSTAHDMARFIRMHLGGGQIDGERLLLRETIEQMHRQLFTQHPRLPGNAHGFWERYRNGLRTLEHGGEWLGYGANLVLIPQHEAGFFFAYTGANELVRSELATAILDRFYPAPDNRKLPTTSLLSSADVERFAGRYRTNQYARTTFEKVALMARDTAVRVVANDDGSLTLHYPAGMGPPTRWLAIEPLLFQQDSSDTMIAFRQDAAGEVTHIFLHYFDLAAVGERVATFWSRPVQIPTAAASLLLLLSPLLVLPLTRRYRRVASGARDTRTCDVAALSVAALYLSFVIGMIAVLWPTFLEPLFGLPNGFAFVLTLPLIALGAAVPFGGLVLRLWLQRRGPTIYRAYLTAVLFAAFVLSASLDNINFLGPHL